MVRARLRFLFVVILAVTANLVTASREVLQAQDICGVSGRCDVELFYDTPTGGLTLDFHRPATVVELQSATGIFGGERPAELTGTFDAFDAHKLFAIRPEGWSGVVEFGPALLPNLSCAQISADLSAAIGLQQGGLGRVVLGNPCDGPLPADLNEDNSVDVQDIDYLIDQLNLAPAGEWLDLDNDEQMNTQDLDYLVYRMLETWPGDANLDGEFSTSDLTTVFQAGQYEDAIVENSGWAAGDWTGDHEFNSSDLIHAFQFGSYEQGPHGLTTVGTVPEPAAALLATLGLLLMLPRIRQAYR